jgi:hypothetical protein
MGKYWKLLAEYDAETATYSNCAGAAQTSPYTPTESAKLIGLRVIVGSTAATTLVEAVQFKLTCSTFKPNSIEVLANGNGLRTAPAANVPPVDYPVDQPVQAGVPITVEARNVAGTPVTVQCFLMGEFVS